LTHHSKSKTIPKKTDAERHKRFLDVAKRVEASEDPADFDKAVRRVVSSRKGLTQASPPENESDDEIYHN
jgi:hypothetical protein